MLKKIKSALLRADTTMVSVVCLTLATAGACAAYAPHTDEVAVRPATVAAAPAVSLPTAAQLVAENVAPIAPPPALRPSFKPDSEALDAVAQQILTKTSCLASAMYYEARGEGKPGELAIAEVVYNRSRDRDYPRDICGVVFQGQHDHGCQFSFACNGEMDRPKNKAAWRTAVRLAFRIVTGSLALSDTTDDAISFHASDVQPNWSGDMEKTVQIGHHIFYRSVRHALTRGA